MNQPAAIHAVQAPPPREPHPRPKHDKIAPMNYRVELFLAICARIAKRASTQQ